MSDMDTTTSEVEEKEYDVHVYAIVRLKVAGIKAKNQRTAIVIADELTSLHQLLDSGSINKSLGDGVTLKEIEWAEEIDSYHIDERGDTEYKNSGTYMSDGETPWVDSDTCVEVYLDNGQIAIHRLPPGIGLKRIQGPLPSPAVEDPFKDQHISKGPIGLMYERMLAFYKTR